MYGDEMFDEDFATLERCEVEFGGELPDLNAAGGATPQQRARRILRECKRQGEGLSDDDRAAIKRLAV